MSDDQVLSPPPGTNRHLLLLGAGPSHLQVLRHWAAHPIPGIRITLVSAQPHTLHTRMLPGWVAGRYRMEECSIPLAPLVERSHVEWVQHSVKEVDIHAQTVHCNDGSTLGFDCLSIDTGPMHNRERIEQAMPGCREHALFAHPCSAFATLWPQVAAMGDERALRVAIIGGDSIGIELAFAVRKRLPNSAITLLIGQTLLGAPLSAAARTRLQTQCRHQRITVLQDIATGISAGAVHLGCGAELACDVPLVALPSHAPSSLASSGLALDLQGNFSTNPTLQSSSHPRIFVATENAQRTSGTLIHNLFAAIQEQPLRPYIAPVDSLEFLSCGSHRAVASWGPYAVQGRFVAWLKDLLDRKWMRELLPVQH
jgi:NADH dehydrogenase FAD-containing subunit